MPLPETITYEEGEARYQCNKSTLSRAVKRGDIIAYKPGAHVLMEKESADKWFMSTKIKPVVRRGRPRRSERRTG